MSALRRNGGEELQPQFQQVVWQQELAFDCYGVTFGIRVNKKGFLESENDFLPYNSKPIELGTVEHLFSILLLEKDECYLYCNNEDVWQIAAEDIHSLLKARIRQSAAAETAQKVFVHAGVVAWNNQLIMLPAHGYHGKTTLTAELVKAGAVYYSDEFAVIDKDGLVYPYPKPLSMRKRNSTDSTQTDVTVESIGGVQGTQPLPVSLVVLTQYRAGGRWQPQALSPGQAVIEMIKFTNSSLKNPELSIKVLKKIAIQATIVKTVRGDAAKAARAVLGLLQN